MFSITEFKSNVKVVRPNLFYADILYLPSAASGTSYASSKFKFRCEVAELPGKTIATVDDQMYGPTAKFAYDVTYNDINLQIIASDDMAERKMFESWIDNIVTPSKGGVGTSGGLIKYYSDYALGIISLNQLRENGTKICTYTLYNAYPIQLSPMNLTWEETNTYQRFTVTMTYRYHTAEFY